MSQPPNGMTRCNCGATFYDEDTEYVPDRNDECVYVGHCPNCGEVI